jgi:Fur family ferric uptake transcriptional regulator
LSALKSAESALSHDMVMAEVSEGIDRATVYRVLNRFCEDGVAHRIVGDDGKQYFALCLNCEEKSHRHNHFHFRCVTCGTVECLDNEVQVSLPKGYTLERFNGLVSGVCSRCGSGA